MLKKNKGLLILTSLIILLPMAVGILLWDSLPEVMPTHWGANGQPNGWSSRPVAVFGMPLVLLVLHWVCMWVTDRDRKNKGQSEKVMILVMWLVPLVSLLGCSSTYAAALGRDVPTVSIATLFLGVVLIIVGNYLPKCKQNRAIGIKIKWTLENEENWNATHRLAGKLWVVGGLGILVCGLLSVTYLMPVLLAAVVLIPVIYSWRYSKR